MTWALTYLSAGGFIEKLKQLEPRGPSLARLFPGPQVSRCLKLIQFGRPSLRKVVQRYKNTIAGPLWRIEGALELPCQAPAQTLSSGALRPASF